MKKDDCDNLDIIARLDRAMKTMEVIIKFTDNEILRHQADYAMHKIGNVKTTVIALTEKGGRYLMRGGRYERSIR